MKRKTNCRSVRPLFTALVGVLLPARLLAVDLDLELVGSYLTAGYVRVQGVAVSGNYAYVAEQPRWDGTNYVGVGLEVIDIRNPANPQRVGGYSTGGAAHGVAVSGNYVCVVDAGGLHVVDISDPANPHGVGRYVTGGWANGVAVCGNYAYVADSGRWNGTNLVGSGLEVIDISNPANPRRAGGYSTGGEARGVAVSGNHAYLVDGGISDGTNTTGGLHVIDISNPANPQRIGNYQTSGYPQGVAVSGSYAYVADFNYGLQMIDISNPVSPRGVGAYATQGYTGGMAVSGNFAYVAYLTDVGSGGLEVIDIGNPANPQHAAGYVLSHSAWHVAVSGNYAYVADEPHWNGTDYVGSGLYVIDMSRWANPQRVSSYDSVGWARGVAVSGDYAYVAAWGLQVIDISNPASPQHIGRYNTGGYVEEVAVSAHYAYLAGQPYREGTNYVGGGLHVIDVSDPTNPQRLGSYDSPHGYTYSVAVSGNHAYLADRDGLQVIDISNPTDPRRVGGYATGPARAVAVSGNYAYVSAGWDLHIIDISDPANPQRVGSYSTVHFARGVALSGNRAYVLGLGLHVVDVSDPTNPLRLGSYDPGGYVEEVAVSGNYAYLVEVYQACTDFCVTVGGELQVIDISDPANLRRVGGNPNVYGFAAVTVSNGKVFVAAAEQGLTILHEYQPIRFEQMARQDSGAMRLRIAGPPGVPGRVQRSADLRTWADWLSVNFAESALEISDPDAALRSASFYRLAVP